MVAGQEVRTGVLLDTETTGLDHVKDEIIEPGMVKFDYTGDGRIVGVDTFSAFNEPSVPISAEVTALTGITDEMVAGHRFDDTAIAAFAENAVIVIAHNSGFDRKFAEREPSVPKFLELIQLVYMFGFPPEARSAVLKAIAMLRAELATTDPDFAQAALDLAALIAARNHDAELAETVAVVAIERVATERGVERLLPTISVFLECAAAIADRKEALATLARRLENIAFVASAALLPDALDAFRILQSINEDLAPLLGRAIATTRLGLPRGNAA